MTLWTPTHIRTWLPSIIVMLAIAVAMRLTLGKKSIKIRRIPFQILACLIVVLEIGKQALSLAQGYDLYTLPFHFCSMLIFLPFIMAFYRGKHERTVSCITTAVASATALLTTIYPDLIYSAQAVQEFTSNYSSFHTVFFHNLASFYVFLMVAMKMYEINVKQDLIYTAIFLSAYVILATILSYSLETNFHNLYKCNIEAFWDVVIAIEQSIGVWARVIYVSIVFVLTTVIAYIGYFLTILIAKLSDTLAKSFSKSKEN